MVNLPRLLRPQLQCLSAPSHGTAIYLGPYLLWIASFTAVMTVGRFSSKLKSFLSTHTAYSFTVCLLAASSMLKFLMWCNVNKCIKSLIRTFVRPLQMLSSMLQHDFKIQEPLLLQRNRATRNVSWNRVKCCTNVRWISCENVCKWWMTFKVIQGHCRCYHLIGHMLFPISLSL